jgi:hypothetical protein
MSFDLNGTRLQKIMTLNILIECGYFIPMPDGAMIPTDEGFAWMIRVLDYELDKWGIKVCKGK